MEEDENCIRRFYSESINMEGEYSGDLCVNEKIIIKTYIRGRVFEDVNLVEAGADGFIEGLF
jgi:hypothetical protein